MDAAHSQFDWPFFALTDDVRAAAAAHFANGRPIALATLVDVQGGSPRPLGARLLIGADGEAAGYVSGGCVESAAAEWGREVIGTGAPRRVVLGAGSPYVDIQLPCGGRIELYIERIAAEDDVVAPWLAGRNDRRVRFWLADLQSGAREVVLENEAAAPALHDAASLAARLQGEAAREGEMFVRRETPRTRLALIGGDPVALALARLARAMDWEVVLLRERGPHAGPAGLDVAYESDDPPAALARLGVDRWTAVISTTHDAERDQAALAQALHGNALYVGALGSRRRAPALLAGLRDHGLDAAQVERVRSPVGLSIGAATPHEIAIAAIADIVRVRRRGEDARDVAS